jgi:hypothetical protein
MARRPERRVFWFCIPNKILQYWECSVLSSERTHKKLKWILVDTVEAAEHFDLTNSIERLVGKTANQIIE